MVGIPGQRDAIAYCATKAGQLGITKALGGGAGAGRGESERDPPSRHRHPLMRERARSTGDLTEALGAMGDIHPLGRMATIEEIGRACLFLASGDAAFVTGHSLEVDGGAALGY